MAGPCPCLYLVALASGSVKYAVSFACQRVARPSGAPIVGGGPKEQSFSFSRPHQMPASSPNKKRKEKNSPRQPDVGDRAAVLEDRLDRKLVDVGLDVAHVDGGAQLLLLLLLVGWGRKREMRERKCC